MDNNTNRFSILLSDETDNECSDTNSSISSYSSQLKNTTISPKPDSPKIILEQSKITKTNKNRILCRNMIKFGKCNYKNKCIYSHSIETQTKDPLRKKVYEMIIDNNNLSDINIVKNKSLFNTIKQLTKVCKKCIVQECPGGYNCKFGVFDKKYQLCYIDVMSGRCLNLDCKLVHLTKKNFVPYDIQKFNNKNKSKNEKNLKKTRILKQVDKIKKLRLLLGGKNIRNGIYNSSDSDQDDDFKGNYEYIHNSNNYSDDETIFAH